MAKSSSSSFVSIITVFLFWGFLAASNGIFIPFCKTHFHLSQFQSQLIDFAFFFAYFIGSLILFMISLKLNSDIINKLGYKTTIILGLSISIIGITLAITLRICIVEKIGLTFIHLICLIQPKRLMDKFNIT